MGEESMESLMKNIFQEGKSGVEKHIAEKKYDCNFHRILQKGKTSF
ncbi:uncharacterized protein G2W53_008619 [Senna tora]|uniref:Uncharacterized protein n=1 Tax=Senna tora TaxID=362788 RepID=A0A835CIA2_9FABA|nr:uncharacterized protein G2W53_008619 [Senna tora]